MGAGAEADRVVVRADAPGRVNLIGEHTDYNSGFVLPSAIPQRARVELARRHDGKALVRSRDVGAGGAAEYVVGSERAGRGWLDYVQGVTAILIADGHRVGGFELRVGSDVPIGAGVSSSAALEVATLRALRAAFALELDDVALALVAQRAENEFVGARVGIMDQLAASLCDERTALFIDTRSLAYERLPLPADGDLVVVHSGITHAHASGGYNRRREECERACAVLGVTSLRELSETDLPRVLSLAEPLGRRVRHVLTENARVVRTADALRAGAAAEAIGPLLSDSHRSMRDDYEVSIPQIDVLVGIAEADDDVFGARLTGGGFGGAIVAIVRGGTGAGVAARVSAAYERAGGQPSVLVPVAS